ncbi:MAG: hypothetical protein M3R46_16105 [Actinomycetota bacterium]|nr:hypothetical protein [Actinomycetota bacterium]
MIVSSWVLTRWKSAMFSSRLGLVGDVQDDQPTGAQLLGDVLLGVGVDLAARGAPAESMARKA